MKGTYALVLNLDHEATIAVGRLGSFRFPRGWYLYSGSALGGLDARFSHHMRPVSRPHWHIDYLRTEAVVSEVWYTASDRRLECDWHQAAAGMPQSDVPVPGFGSSGCSCRAHLVFFPAMPSFDLFLSELGDGGKEVKRLILPPDVIASSRRTRPRHQK